MELRLKNIFSELYALSKYYMIDPPYIVGGAPREQVIYGKAVIGGSNKFKIGDLDITTNSSDCMRLAILFASRNNFKFRIFEDRHITVFCDGFNLDFSSNYISKNAVDFLKSEQCTEFLCPAFPEIKEKVLETYSRDFTINTLHQNIRTGQIIDILDRAFQDIEDKVIRTVLTPEITIVDDPRRVFRAIKFAAKFNFKIDEKMKSFVLNNKDTLFNNVVKENFISSEISTSMLYNPKLTIQLLKDMGLLGMVSMTGRFKDYIIANKLVIEYLDSPRIISNF